MGFLSNAFGSDSSTISTLGAIAQPTSIFTSGLVNDWIGANEDSSDSQYQASSYTTSVGSPTIKTDTTISKAETAKTAETADTKEYDEMAAKKRKKNGVKGTFTNFAGDTSGTAVQKDAIGA